MARADSTIRVNIIGDAKSLQKAAGTAEGAVGGMNKKLIAAGGIIAGAFAVDAVTDFASTAVKEADRVADAAGRIEAQLGPDLAKVLRDRADDFAALGQSEGDMLDLEARFIDIGTAAGIADDELGPLAEDAAEVAGAMQLATDIPADEWISKIGKAAASGEMRSLRDLGVNLDEAAVNARALADTGKPTVDALTESEVAAARAALIIEDLTGRYGDATSAGGDLESKQLEIAAKLETLTGKIGGALEGPLNDLLDWILSGIEGWELFAQWVGANEDALREFAAPAAVAADVINNIADAFWNVIDAIASIPELPGWLNGSFGGSATLDRFSRTRSGSGFGSGGTFQVNVNGGSPEAIEQAVRTALRHATGRGPLE